MVSVREFERWRHPGKSKSILTYKLFNMKILNHKGVLPALFILLVAQISLFAQPVNGERMHERMEEMKAKRIAYISTAINLTPAEAVTFWPIYNEYDRGMMEFQKRKLKGKVEQNREVRGPSKGLSDTEANAEIMEQFRNEQAVLDHRKAYYEKFKKVISPAKILKLYDAEMRFRMEIVREFGERERERRR